MLKHHVWNKIIYPIFICFLGSLFYLYDFVLRVFPSVLSHELMSRYHITAAGYGLLSAFFFVGYMLMQVPCGLLFDRYGPRRILTINCLIAGIATFLFMATSSFIVASIARLLMGIGSAFAYIGALVLAMRWLPKKYYAMTAGIIQLMGSVGAIVGQTLLAYLFYHFSTDYVVGYLASFGLILAVLFWFFISDYRKGIKNASSKRLKTKFHLRTLRVVRNKQNLCTALYAFAIWAPISIFAVLWDVPFLQAQNGFNQTTAATLAAGVWIGIACGGPLFGWVSEYIHLRRLPLLLSSFIGLIVSIMIIYQSGNNKLVIEILLLLFGFAGSSMVITFGLVQDNNPPYRGATAAGFNNMAIVVGGALLQPLVGFLLHWHTRMPETMPPTYLYADYQFALIVLPICYIIAFLTALFLIQETHCKPQFAE